MLTKDQLTAIKGRSISRYTLLRGDVSSLLAHIEELERNIVAAAQEFEASTTCCTHCCCKLLAARNEQVEDENERFQARLEAAEKVCEEMDKNFDDSELRPWQAKALQAWREACK